MEHAAFDPEVAAVYHEDGLNPEDFGYDADNQAEESDGAFPGHPEGGAGLSPMIFDFDSTRVVNQTHEPLKRHPRRRWKSPASREAILLHSSTIPVTGL